MLDWDKFHIKKVNGEAFVGNLSGPNIAIRLVRLKKKLFSQQGKLIVQEKHLKDLQEEVHRLQIASE